MYDNDPDYEDFLGSEQMNFLKRSNNERFEDEMSRPKIEIWPDDDWAEWVSSHDEKRRTLICNLPSMKSSPFCAMGYH